MPRYLVFGRHEYEKPLVQVGEVDADAQPTLDQVGLGDDWLELVAIPVPSMIWVLRDAELVRNEAGAST